MKAEHTRNKMGKTFSSLKREQQAHSFSPHHVGTTSYYLMITSSFNMSTMSQQMDLYKCEPPHIQITSLRKLAHSCLCHAHVFLMTKPSMKHLAISESPNVCRHSHKTTSQHGAATVRILCTMLIHLFSKWIFWSKKKQLKLSTDWTTLWTGKVKAFGTFGSREKKANWEGHMIERFIKLWMGCREEYFSSFCQNNSIWVNQYN